MPGREVLKSIDSNVRKSNEDPFRARSKLARSPVRGGNSIKKNSGIKKAQNKSVEKAGSSKKVSRSEIMRDITQNLENLCELAAIPNNNNNYISNKTTGSSTKKTKAKVDDSGDIKQQDGNNNNNNNIVEKDLAKQIFKEVQVEPKEESRITSPESIQVPHQSSNNKKKTKENDNDNYDKIEEQEQVAVVENKPKPTVVKNIKKETKAKSSRLNASLFKLNSFNKKTFVEHKK